MKIITPPNIIIYNLCKNLDAISKSHLCFMFNAIRNITSNYVIILQNIGVNKFIFIDI